MCHSDFGGQSIAGVFPLEQMDTIEATCFCSVLFLGNNLATGLKTFSKVPFFIVQFGLVVETRQLYLGSLRTKTLLRCIRYVSNRVIPFREYSNGLELFTYRSF